MLILSEESWEIKSKKNENWILLLNIKVSSFKSFNCYLLSSVSSPF